MNLFLGAIAVLIGTFLPIQAGVNNMLRQFTGSSLNAAMVSLSFGSMCLVGLSFVVNPSVHSFQFLVRLPWWSWLGGILGALYLVSSIILVSRLGAATLVSALISGQLLASLLLDHFGLIGLPIHQVSITRLTGAGFLIVGTLLIQRG